MRLIEHNFPSAAENVALDEALLLEAEQTIQCAGILRLWEPTKPLVVVGRASNVAEEVCLAACREDGVPVLRRSSGGAAIVAGPGCLMYAVVLGYDRYPELIAIDRAHQFVLGTHASALAPIAPGIERAGISDLAIDGLKVSGNSMRCRRRWLLYHGTLLYDMQLELIDRYLSAPPRQPDYRDGRPHHMFVTNINTTRQPLRDAIVAAWNVEPGDGRWPENRTRQLVAEKYSRAEWTMRHP